jgi:cytochrome c553
MLLKLTVSLSFAIAGAMWAALAHSDVNGDPVVGKTKALICVGCHGVDGNGGADPSWPRLAGQIPDYLLAQLKAFKIGARKNPIMKGMAEPLKEQDMRDLVAYFSSQTLRPGVAVNREFALAGRRLYRGGNAETGVPACMSCHGPSGHGIPPRFPRVTGQNARYTEQQLVDFKASRRVDSDGVMTRVAFRMSEGEIRAASEYMAGLH